MDEAARLRELAAQCRQMAATLHARETAETLLEMARQFEASANDSESLIRVSRPELERSWG